jgi:hypothetical protein
MRAVPAVFAAAAALVGAGTAFAHHGWSSYQTDLVTVEAAVKTADWANPHGSITVDHAGRTWNVVLAPVARMEARGLTAADIKPGSRVKLEGYVARDGSPEMRIERITAAGKTVELR